MKSDFLKQYKAQIIIAFIFFLLALFFNIYRIASDSRLYYDVLEEKFFHNLNPHPLQSIYTDTGGYQQFGVVFFWFPFYFIALFFTKLALFNFAPIVTSKGFLSITTIFIHLAGNFYTLLTLFLGVHILNFYKLRVNKIFVTLATFFSTPLFVYGIPLAHFNHAIDAFILSLFVYLFLICKDKEPSFQFFVGVLIAISTLIRYLNASMFIFLLLYYLVQKKMQPAKFLLFGFFSIIWILPASHYLINNSVLGSIIFRVNNTTNSLAGIKLIPKYSLKLLFHPIHGLFLWSPITILSFFGLIQYYQDDKKTALFFIGIFLSLLLAQGCFYNWHAGWSFSQRYFTGMFPVFLFGFGYYLSRYPKTGLVLGVIFTLYTLFLLLNWGTIIHGELGTPIDMVQAWASKENSLGLIIAKFKDICHFLH